ncbi:polysaccharide biosynthesis/export family protein [Roseovarius bejariae]|nr:polysaccharide biosynthesis/export family protein [Roseovarius bejariae]
MNELAKMALFELGFGAIFLLDVKCMGLCQACSEFSIVSSTLTGLGKGKTGDQHMSDNRRLSSVIAAFSVLMVVAGCSLPRGAAIQSEVLSEQNAETPSFQVVPVTRNMTPVLEDWPSTGWQGHYHWFGRDRGPDSNVIQVGDVLNIVVWESQDNSLLSAPGSNMVEMPAQEVSASGKVFLPYVGDLRLKGLTSDAARQRIQNSFEEIAPSAQVQVSVVEGRNNSIDLVGGVAAPGSYPLESRNTKILSAIAKGGGVKSGLRNPLLRLQRRGKTYETPVADLLEDARRNVRLRGGDQIAVVEDERSFNVLGAAGSQQMLYFEKENMSAMEALSAMGGLEASRANPKGVLVLREYEPDDLKPGPSGPDMQQVVFTIDLTTADGLFAARQFQINPGDTLLATESPVNAARTIIGLFGTVIGVTGTVNNL